ncbi:MAG: hypothetical protein K2Q01_05480, partial [Rickettsiales bacterium]|nr:hypothetical protein [Rickettsiales bacterium]
PAGLKTFAEKFQETFGTGFIQIKNDKGVYEAMAFRDMSITQKHEFLQQAKAKISDLAGQLQKRYNPKKYVGIDTRVLGFELIEWHPIEWGDNHDYADEAVRKNWFGNKPDQVVNTAKGAKTLRELHDNLKEMLDDSIGKPGSGAADNLGGSVNAFSQQLTSHMQYLRTAEADRGKISVFAHHARFMETALSMAQTSDGLFVTSNRINDGKDPATGQVRPPQPPIANGVPNDGWILYKNIKNGRYYYLEGSWNREEFTVRAITDRATGETRAIAKARVEVPVTYTQISEGSTLLATSAPTAPLPGGQPPAYLPPRFEDPNAGWMLYKNKDGRHFFVNGVWEGTAFVRQSVTDAQTGKIHVPQNFDDIGGGLSIKDSTVESTARGPNATDPLTGKIRTPEPDARMSWTLTRSKEGEIYYNIYTKTKDDKGAEKTTLVGVVDYYSGKSRSVTAWNTTLFYKSREVETKLDFSPK